MKFRGYNVEEAGDSVVIEGIRDFDPVHIFECGQCFRWLRQEDGSYTGVVGSRAANVAYENGRMRIAGANAEDFKNIWYDYFDLGRDYGAMKKKLHKMDRHMKAAVEFGEGIRILRQDIWEMLISFILSANNRIPMIMRIVEAISRIYGNETKLGDRTCHTFPTARALAATDLKELELCSRGGFRCKYIINTSRLLEEGAVKLDALKSMSSGEAREELKKLPGVGNKVADCILLYSGTKYDVFPTDVWVKRVMEELYFGREASLKEIQAFAADYFGSDAGFAQQYLFYYAKENRIGAS